MNVVAVRHVNSLDHIRLICQSPRHNLPTVAALYLRKFDRDYNIISTDYNIISNKFT